MTDTLQIVTFLWGDKYTKEHVRRLGDGLRRHLRIPFDFVLITDRPEAWAVPGSRDPQRVIRLWDEMRDAKLCGVRLRCFGPSMESIIGRRFAWIDLDMVITGDVTPIFRRTEDFIALATPQGPLAYNGSLVMMDAGARPLVYSRWNMADYHRLGLEYAAKHRMSNGTVSDEGWMTIQLGTREATVGVPEGIHYYKKLAGGKLPKDARMVVMNGRRFDPSFPHLQKQSPWIAEHWGGPI